MRERWDQGGSAFSVPILGTEQRQADTPGHMPTRPFSLLWERGFMGEGRQEAWGSHERGEKPLGFTDPCCHQLGWRETGL